MKSGFTSGIKKMAITLWLAFFALPMAHAQTTAEAGSGNTLLIFQIGAGATDAETNVSRSFVELYNAGEQPVNLSGYSLQYAAGTRGATANAGTEDGAWRKIDLEGIILPNHSFLILGNRLSTMSSPRLNIENNSGDINVSGFQLSNRSVKVALISNTELLTVQNPFDIDGNGTKVAGYVDMIGVVNEGTGSNPDKIRGFEGDLYFIADQYRISKQIGVRRTSLIDTDNNSSDFEAISYRDVAADVIENKRPRNHSYGAWDPFPEDIEPTDPVLAGNPDELAGKLLILQAYSSSNSAAGASHSFVELYNNTGNTIELDGITLYYADGTRSTTATKDNPWKKISLNGTMLDKTSFLVLGRRESNLARLQITDNSGDINDHNNFSLSNRAFKVALIRNTKDLAAQNPFNMDGKGAKAAGYIDMVGAANTYLTEDLIFGFESYPARNSASVAVRRKTLTDTDNNKNDFASIDYRAWSEDNPDRTTDEQLEIYRPKNLAFGPWNTVTGKQEEPDIQDGPAQEITSFKFSHKSIGWEGDGYWEGVIDQNAKTITFTTQQWIANIDRLPAIFELDDDGIARVNEKSQWSGFTQNDFRKDVIYTVGESQYTVKFVSPQATGLPVIKIDTENGDSILNREDWVAMTFALTDPNNPQNDIYAISNQQIRGRGNSTWNYPKKPYRVRFRSGQEQSPFGLPAARNWALLAEYLDPTFLTTAVAFELGQNIFELPFSCTYHHIQLYLNGDYQGIYVLTEHRQVDPNEVGAPGRVKVDLNEGWFVELDAYWDEDPKFRTTNYDLPIMIKSPDFDSNSDDVRYSFIKDNWNELCDSMASVNFPENGYRDLIDMNTFIDFLMANETVKNDEIWWPKSVFSYKDKDEKISMGPLWDFDWAFSYAKSGHTYFVNYLGRLGRHGFFRRFFEDPTFIIKYKERWNEKYDEIINVREFIETLGENIRVAVEEDSKRWNVLDGYMEDYDNDHARQTGNMINWWKQRTTWLNTELNKVNILPNIKDFGTVDFKYSEISPQTFTLVAYDEMSNLKATFKKGNLSDFEISTGVIQTPTGNGGYLATISVKPKNLLPSAIYTDTLVFNGDNQGNMFSIEVPLNFAVEKEEEQEKKLKAWTQNNVLYVSGLVEDKLWRVYNVSGTLVHQAVADKHEADIALPEWGVYFIQSENKTIKVIVP